MMVWLYIGVAVYALLSLFAVSLAVVAGRADLAMEEALRRHRAGE